MKCLEGMGLSRAARWSRTEDSPAPTGCFVGHISPEAYEGGVLALVEDGDSIAIDVPAGSLELLWMMRSLNEGGSAGCARRRMCAPAI